MSAEDPTPKASAPDEGKKSPTQTNPRGKSKGKGKGKKKKSRRGVSAQTPTIETHQPPLPWWVVGLVGVGLLGLTVWAWPPRPAPEPHVAHGNELFAQRKFPDSLGEYESAPGAGPRNAGVQLDRGIARYRVTLPPGDGGFPMMESDASAPEGLTRAQDELRTAARGGTTNASEDVDALLRSSAAYDLGNTMFSQHDWDHAIESYKESLRLRPAWRDAAWNLELARRLREAERNPPDAGQDSGQDSGNDASPPDAGNDAGHDSGNDSGNDGAAGDSGAHGDSGGQGDSGSQGQDSGSNQRDGGGNQPDSGSNGAQDAATPPQDAAQPRSMAPLDDLDRSSRSLQYEMLRRRGGAPREPDDDR